jgi:hypothetical protein
MKLRKYPALMISFKVWDKNRKNYITAYKYGRLFDLDGVDIKLFPIRVMAEAVNRTNVTLLAWEKEGRFPTPMYKVPNTIIKRWYSENQILKANEIALKYAPKGKSKHLDVDNMLKEFRDMFYKVDLEIINRREATDG